MRGKRLSNIFLGFISVITILTGALLGETNKAGLSFAAGEAKSFDPDQYLGEGQQIIRIATWYSDSNIKNLKAFLANKFPDYIFEFEYVDKSNYEPIIDAKLSYKGAPDILYMDQEMVKKHATTRYILNVTDLGEDFTDEAKEAFGYGNEVYAIPNTSQFECIYYNKELFKNKGVNVPYSFETFIGSCDLLRIVKGIKPVAVSLKDPYTLANSALGIAAADYFATDRGAGFGGRLQYGRTTFVEELLPYMDDWEEYLYHEIFTNDMYTMDKRTAVDEFVSEKAAMIIGGPETYNAIIEQRHDMDIGTLPFFGTKGARKAIIGGCDVGFAVNANSRNPDAAIEVARALTTYEGQQALWMDRQGSKTYLKNVNFVNIDVYDGIQDCYDEDLVFSPWMDWGMELNRPIHFQFGRELQRVLLKRTDMNKALSSVDAMVYEILREE